MAAALLGYFGSMVAALVGIVLLSNTLLTRFPMDELKPHPHLRPALAQTADADNNERRSIAALALPLLTIAPLKADADTPTPTVRADAEKAKRLKIARYRQHQMLAREREQRQYTAALGYNQQPSYAPNFGPFGAGRF